MFNFTHSTNRSAEIMDSRTDADYSDGIDTASDPPQLMVVWEHVLQHLNWGERIYFLSIFCCITVFGTLGNLLTLYVIFTR